MNIKRTLIECINLLNIDGNNTKEKVKEILENQLENIENYKIKLKPKSLICIDFDGTLVENDYPSIGRPIYKMIKRVKYLQEQGHEIILWTCREDEKLEEALTYLKNYFDFTPNYVNENPKYKIEKYGTDPRKVGADYYIDDKKLSLDDFLEME